MVNQIVVISNRPNAGEKFKELVTKKLHQGFQTGQFEENVIKSKLSGFQVLGCHDYAYELESLRDASPDSSCR